MTLEPGSVQGQRAKSILGEVALRGVGGEASWHGIALLGMGMGPNRPEGIRFPTLDLPHLGHTCGGKLGKMGSS